MAPKIIGGVHAPSPVGDMGMVEMTQALNLEDVSFEQVSPVVSRYIWPMLCIFQFIELCMFVCCR